MTNDTTAIPDEVDVDDLDELHEVLPDTFSITSYGADYPVDGLVKRLSEGEIIIPRFSMEPEEDQTTIGFQREFVWKRSQSDRFIESLLLGLPVPSIFLVKEPNGKFLVLDGQQRLETLQSFYNGILDGTEFKLSEVQQQWVGKTYNSLSPEDRRQLDNSILHAIIVRQDTPTEDQSSIYLIFERLNSGGTILKPQEIRVALYHGKFASLLSKLNDFEPWRTLYGRKNSRLKDIELILRFLSLYFYSGNYERPMKAFLNRYMSANQDLSKQTKNIIRPIFEQTTSAILENIGSRAFKPFGNAINAAVLESVMVGVSKRIAREPITDLKSLKHAYNKLIVSEKYLGAVKQSTAHEDSVNTRLDEAIAAFADLT